MITFDFNHTLTRPLWNSRYKYWEPSSTPNYKIIASLKVFHQQNQEVRIVTSRYPCEEILDFVKDHKLPITQIHFTSGKLKGETLLTLGSTLHFDDSPDELAHNQSLGIKTILVAYRFDIQENRECCDLFESVLTQ